MHVRMKDGTEVGAGPGDIAFVPPGHDAWAVEGPLTGVEFVGGRIAVEGPKKA